MARHPEHYPGLYHAAGLTQTELGQLRRKLKCHAAPPRQQRRLFPSIEQNDPELAEQMVRECLWLQQSLVPPQALLEPSATGGRVEPLQDREISDVLQDVDSERRETIVNWLKDPDARFEPPRTQVGAVSG